MLDWKEFGKFEWNAFNGATKFVNGEQPLIAEIEVDGYAGFAIIDANGVTVGWTDDDREEDRNATPARSYMSRVVALLTPEMTSDELTEIGFTVL